MGYSMECSSGVLVGLVALGVNVLVAGQHDLRLLVLVRLRLWGLRLFWA